MPCAAEAAVASKPAPRIVNNNVRVVLPGNVHPLAKSSLLVGATDPSLPMERMILSLRLSSDKQGTLENFLAEQQDPSSPNFHRWLTPEEFGARFGPLPEDLATLTNWLRSQGFSIDEVAKGGTWINFSGTAGQVETAFQTKMRNFNVNGRLRHANATDPAIPLALADLVSGVVTLHNFPRSSMIARMEPAYTAASGSHYLSPGDFATIYNVNPLYAAGIDGSGQNIAIVGRTHPSSSNWSSFRSLMGLSVNPPVVVVNGIDPGDLGANEDGEADLDVEWSGAVARAATIKFVVSQSTNSSDGVDLSAQYIVNNNLAPVMSTSFGLCEFDLGSAGLAFYNNLWMQAAALGITSFVSSGDSGAADCDGASSSRGSGGRAVNGLASSPYNIAVGGTQFNEGAGSYWNSNNASGYSSAKNYIPEVAWNESGNMPGGSGLWATGGGASATYSKPSWQVAPGVPADGSRDVPDVSLTSAAHDGYLIVSQGNTYASSGTSASAPAFAGIMALIVQKTGQRQGNANSRFYQLANAQYMSGGTAVFHDIVSGNNSVPGVTGFTTSSGYDLATGLGSVDATALANTWAGTTPSACSYSLGASSVALGASAASGVVSITTTTACTWTAVSNEIWITVISGVSGSGNGSVAYSVDTNTSSSSRTGTITIANQIFTINQAGVSFTLPAAPSNVTATAGNASATVSFTPGSIGSGTLVTYWAACGVDNAHLIYGKGSSSPITVTGLTNGTTYYCWALTESTAGYSNWSMISNSISPRETTSFGLSVVKWGMGSGTVTSSPSGINCGTTCSATFSSGTAVTLTATAASGSTFTGWSGGACTGTGNCSLTISAVQQVVANFASPSLTFTTVGAVYNIPSPDASDKGYLRVYNTTNTSGYVGITLYDTGGAILGTASYTMPAYGVQVLSSNDLSTRFGVSAWSGRAWAEISTTLPTNGLAILNTVRSAALSNMSCVANRFALVIPPPGNSDTAYIRFYNIGSSTGAIRGTLRDENGNTLGGANQILVSALGAKSVAVLDASQIKTMVGAPIWSGKAWLDASADFGSNLKIMNTVRDASGTLNNMSCAFP